MLTVFCVATDVCIPVSGLLDTVLFVCLCVCIHCRYCCGVCRHHSVYSTIYIFPSEALIHHCACVSPVGLYVKIDTEPSVSVDSVIVKNCIVVVYMKIQRVLYV